MGQALVQQYQSQQRVEFTDLNGDYAGLTQLMGEILTGITGVFSALPDAGTNSTPLTFNPQGGALAVNLGGTGQAVFVQGQWADTRPAQNYSIPPPSGSSRTDIIAIQYVPIQVNPHSIVVDSDSGPVSGTGYQIAQGIQYQYVAGSTSPPSGYVTFLTIDVPSSAVYGTDCTYTVNLPSISTLIDALVNAGVTSVNGATGAVVVQAGQGINVVRSGQDIIITAQQAAGVQSLTVNSTALTGLITLLAGSGILFNVSGNQVTISANPASSFVGQTVAATTGGGSGTTSLSVSLSALGAGTWLVEAECMGVEFPSSAHSAYIQGSGTGFTNQAGGSYSSSAREFYIAGTCAGGVTPSVAYTATSGCTLQPDTTQVTLTIRATRIL